MKTIYDTKFYQNQSYKSKQSAKEIVPIILEIISPKSLIDIGCGVGTWLSVFHENGVNDFLGVDGEYVRNNELEIPAEKFIPKNLEIFETKDIQRKFDLAMSLEVAEHISASKAKMFVESLTRLAPVVVFSAAIPFQGGIGHVNEQWPGYWQKLFSEAGYITIDCIRHRIWNNDKVSAHYAQNTFIYVKKKKLSNYPNLQTANESASVFFPGSVVHPKIYFQRMQESNIRPENYPIIKYLKQFPLVVQGFIKRKLKYL